MDILKAALEALWQVVVGMVLGAGLPALFALGLRSLGSCRVLVAAGPAAEGEPPPPGAPRADRLSPPTTPGIIGGRPVLRGGGARRDLRDRGHHLRQAAVRLDGRVVSNRAMADVDQGDLLSSVTVTVRRPGTSSGGALPFTGTSPWPLLLWALRCSSPD